MNTFNEILVSFLLVLAIYWVCDAIDRQHHEPENTSCVGEIHDKYGDAVKFVGRVAEISTN